MPYPEDMVAPMRAEAIAAGAVELRTAEQAREALRQPTGTALYFINSVCGCSASSARPALGLSLGGGTTIGARRPQRVYTAFAGNDIEAVNEIRAAMVGYAPSSPSMALFKDGKLVAVIERTDVQGNSATALADRLKALYAQHC